MTGLLLLIIGIIAGGYGTIVGAGGGFIFVPALLILLVMDPMIAAASGLVLVIVLINSVTGSLGYAKQNKNNYKIALMIGISALPGALLGVWLLQKYSSQYFHVIFATILVGLEVFLF